MRVLYHTPLAPFCRKIRMQLRERELECELTQENVWERRLDFFALNPAGEVPVLVEPDGRTVAGHYAIMEYIEEAYGNAALPLLGQTIQERSEVRRLVDWFDRKFDQEVTMNILFEKVFKRLMHCGGPQSDALRAGKKNVLYHLDYIAYLTQEHRYLTGDNMTLADMAAAAHFSSLDYLGDVPWDHNPRAKEWYALMKSRPSLRAVLAERVAYMQPPDHYEDPDF